MVRSDKFAIITLFTIGMVFFLNLVWADTIQNGAFIVNEDYNNNWFILSNPGGIDGRGIKNSEFNLSSLLPVSRTFREFLKNRALNREKLALECAKRARDCRQKAFDWWKRASEERDKVYRHAQRARMYKQMAGQCKDKKKAAMYEKMAQSEEEQAAVYDKKAGHYDEYSAKEHRKAEKYDKMGGDHKNYAGEDRQYADAVNDLEWITVKDEMRISSPIEIDECEIRAIDDGTATGKYMVMGPEDEKIFNDPDQAMEYVKYVNSVISEAEETTGNSDIELHLEGNATISDVEGYLLQTMRDMDKRGDFSDKAKIGIIIGDALWRPEGDQYPFDYDYLIIAKFDETNCPAGGNCEHSYIYHVKDGQLMERNEFWESQMSPIISKIKEATGNPKIDLDFNLEGDASESEVEVYAVQTIRDIAKRTGFSDKAKIEMAVGDNTWKPEGDQYPSEYDYLIIAKVDEVNSSAGGNRAHSYIYYVKDEQLMEHSDWEE